MPAAMIATTGESLSAVLDRAEAAVDSAYQLHDDDLYAPAADRLAAMAESRTAAETIITSAEAWTGVVVSTELQARLHYLRGKAATCGAEGRSSSSAELLLADAVKLDPNLIGAWDALGECYWQRGELEAARGCFHGALAHRRTCASLCHLSMLLRVIAGRSPPDEGQACVLESTSLAKDAVRLEPSSQRAWFSVGNAHLSVYKFCTASADELHLASKAFTQAARAGAGGARAGAGGASTRGSDVSVLNADLAMNHGLALFLLESIAPALDAYSQAHALDPSIGADRMRQDVWEHATRASELLSGKMGLKPRKLASLLAELPPAQEGQPGLGDLKPGANPSVRLVLKLLAPLPSHAQRLHHSFAVADRDGAVAALAVYGKSTPLSNPSAHGATIAVTAPTLVRVQARHWDPAKAKGGGMVRFDCLLIDQQAQVTQLPAGGRGR
jgi:tetratricopeptide (TPR) repeat protein